MTTMAGTYFRRTGQGWLTDWTPDKVAAAPDPCIGWAEYAHQVLGVPQPTLTDMTGARKNVKELFRLYPDQADWYTMCRVVMWVKKRRRHYSRLAPVAACWRDAYGDRFLPELNPPDIDTNLEATIARALDQETDPVWRRRLIATTGMDFRRATLAEWEELRGW
jgi:hypothetical protein